MSAANGDFTVSLIRDAIDTVPVPTRLSELVDGIANGRWATPVQAVRTAFEAGGKKAADAPKKKLPGILFSGTFSHRSNDKLLKHSGLICVDLDKLGNEAAAWKDRIVADPHCICAFVSPTGSGVKAVFRCDPAKDHIESFRAAEHYVKENFGLQIDGACKDVARICFVSHDPEAHLEPHAKALPYPPPEPEEFHAPAHEGGNQPGDDYDRLDEWKTVLKNHGWKEEGKDHWVRPGKDTGTSATWNKCKIPDRFWVFSSDAPPFTYNKAYRPWHIYVLLEHGGSFSNAARALGARGLGQPPKSRQQANLDRIAGPAPGPVKMALRKPSEFAIVQADDPSSLLGNRYLNRGDGMVISGPSGCGKSSMQTQMAALWSLGKDFHGIKPANPMRSLIIQSEDSDGDIAEAWASINHVMGTSEADRAVFDDRVRIVTDRVNRGDRFLASLKLHIKDFKPDLVWINPLQAFIDGDVTQSKDLGKFLREGLNGLNEPATFGYILIHHTTKPATGKDRHERLWHEVMYDMAGGAELINWARAIISLRPATNPGDFTLKLAKRGRRAGVVKMVEQGVGERPEPVLEVPVRHATGKLPSGIPVIFWEGREADIAPVKEPPSGRPEKYLFEDYRMLFPVKTSAGLSVGELWRALLPNGEIKRNQLHQVCKRWAEQGNVEIIDVHGQPRKYRASF